MAERLPKKFGPYVLLEALGRGAAGVVYLARPADPRRAIPTPVVVKTMHDELADVDELVARFRHEAELAVLVSSPNVAKVYDAGMVGHVFYIAMEFVPGVRLSQVLVDLQKKGRLLSIRDTVRIFLGGLRGLEALHGAKGPDGRELDIVHRDLSPKNLMLDRTGEMRLIDLGLGKSNLQSWKTRTGTVMGSPGYMAPEQVRGQTAAQESDTYSMGVVLWELLTATPYIPRGGLTEILLASASPEFRPPSSVRREVPAALDEVLRTALQADRRARFRDARAFRSTLEAVLPKLPGPDASTIELSMVTGLERDPEEIRRLLALDAPRAPSGPDEDKTVVFAERAELRSVSEGDLAPTQVFQVTPGFGLEVTDVPSDSILPGGEPEREETITQPGATPPRPRVTEPPATHTGTWGGPTEPGSRPRLDPRRPSPRGVPVLITAVLVVSAGVLGAVGGRILLPSEPVELSGAATPRALAATPLGIEAPSPTPDTKTSTTSSEPTDAPSGADGPRRPSKKPKRPRPERLPGTAETTTEPRETPAPPPPPASSENVDELARALTRRAQGLKGTRPDKAPELDLILGDIALETASGDSERARRRLRELGRRLDAMAQ